MAFRRIRLHAIVSLQLFAVIALCGASNVATAAEGTVPDLVNDVLPLLKVRCVRCHGPAVQEGKLNLALSQGIRRGGKSGNAIIAGSPENSLIWKLVESDEMPADEPLSPEDKQVLRSWIEGGAPGLPESVAAVPDGDEHWAFQKLRKIAIPQVRDPARCRTEVDFFIQQQLESIGLGISPEASRESLIRRVSFDLTGLPPTLEEIDTFVNDVAVDAYEQMVERYLNSQHYGERWGKYWLDTAGYADSNGYFARDSDRPYAYRYRDYVIRSINADKPWNRFILEQLAGDELAQYTADGDVQPEMVEPLEAVHFLRNSPDGTDASDGNPDELRADKYAVLEGTLQIFGSAVLGITLQCARCHDHKFEPFTQRDYYQLQAVFYPAFNLESWITPEKRVISTATKAELAALKEENQQLDEQISSLRREFMDWSRAHRVHGNEIFSETFDGPMQKLRDAWTNTVPGDAAPAGPHPVKIDSEQAPAAHISDGQLNIAEANLGGSSAISTRVRFDWTPNETGAWIQATFDLVSGGDTAPYVGYYIALNDYNDTLEHRKGNVLIDGAAAGQAAVHVDYPGSDQVSSGKIGKSGYTPGHNYGVRVTNIGEGNFELAQLVDGVQEENRITLKEEDLPDGAFGFEYCCGRSFVVDNVLIEYAHSALETSAEQQQLIEELDRRRVETESAIKQLEGRRRTSIQDLAIVNNVLKEAPQVHLLVRGSYQTPGELVSPAAPHVLQESVEAAASFSAAAPRKELAAWLVAPDRRSSALFARVTVNRWWQHHFGTGLVATPDNLGYSGASPSHPELLEYLANRLIEEDWSPKEMHRLILHSAAYRQTSVETEQARTADPQNRFLSRFPLRRLDAEAIRDALLAIPGELETQMYGPYVATKRSDDGDVVVPEEDSNGRRRSIYLQQRRTQVLGMLETFDAPSIVFNCTARSNTTVPLQALNLLNSDFVRKRALGLARRVRSLSDDQETAIELAFRLTMSRRPRPEELAASKSFIEAQSREYAEQPDAQERAWTDFSQMLFASNFFLYLD